MKRLFKNMAFGAAKINTYLLGAFALGMVLHSHDWVTSLLIIWMVVECAVVFEDEDVERLLENKQKEIQQNN